MPFVSYSRVLREVAGVALNKFPEMKENREKQNKTKKPLEVLCTALAEAVPQRSAISAGS